MTLQLRKSADPFFLPDPLYLRWSLSCLQLTVPSSASWEASCNLRRFKVIRGVPHLMRCWASLTYSARTSSFTPRIKRSHLGVRVAWVSDANRSDGMRLVVPRWHLCQRQRHQRQRLGMPPVVARHSWSSLSGSELSLHPGGTKRKLSKDVASISSWCVEDVMAAII